MDYPNICQMTQHFEHPNMIHMTTVCQSFIRAGKLPKTYIGGKICLTIIFLGGREGYIINCLFFGGSRQYLSIFGGVLHTNVT